MANEFGKEYGMHKSHTDAVTGEDIPENDSMRLRRECMEWIEGKFASCGVIIASNISQEIMDHCFKVALELLNREDAAATESFKGE